MQFDEAVRSVTVRNLTSAQVEELCERLAATHGFQFQMGSEDREKRTVLVYCSDVHAALLMKFTSTVEDDHS